MSDNQSSIEIFCSYAHEDKEWQKKLKKHLSGLQRQGHIFFWHDRLIQAGTDWVQEIDTHLNRASVILLLISSDFIASDYCYGVEMQCALELHKLGKARVIPILLRPVDNWRSEAFANLQALPTDALFITEWGKQHEDAAFADVAAGIRRALEDLSVQPASALHAKLPSIWNIPYPHNPFFIGRQEQLSLIHRRFQEGQATALSQAQAMSGMGG